MSTAPSAGHDDGATRWFMLAIISLGFIALTLNWFDVATAFPLIGAQFNVGLPSLPCAGVLDIFDEGHLAEVDWTTGTVRDRKSVV